MNVEPYPPEPSQPTPPVNQDPSNGRELAPLRGGMPMGELADPLDRASIEDWGHCG